MIHCLLDNSEHVVYRFRQGLWEVVEVGTGETRFVTDQTLDRLEKWSVDYPVVPSFVPLDSRDNAWLERLREARGGLVVEARRKKAKESEQADSAECSGEGGRTRTPRATKAKAAKAPRKTKAEKEKERMEAEMAALRERFGLTPAKA